MKKLEVDNPVLLYKEQGVEMEGAGVNDFMLAIMSPKEECCRGLRVIEFVLIPHTE